MNVELKRLTINNFKGIKNLSIDFCGDSNISGDNGTGKTTIFDAYCWLLWDKNSALQKDFGIKPYKANGENVHNVESTVTGHLSIDGEDLILSKTYMEVWTKKRGSTVEEFSGHTTEYSINNVPIKKKEYNDRIALIIDEEKFNVISNPLYFSTLLDKTKRRTLLLSLITDVTEDMVIAKNYELKELKLDKYSIDELKKMAKATCKKLNKEMESLPVRIDELHKSLIETDDIDEKEADILKNEIETIDNQLNDISKLSETVTKKASELSEMVLEREKIKSDIDNKNEMNRYKAEQALIRVEENKKNKRFSIEISNKKCNEIDIEINNKNSNIDSLRNEWVDVSNSKYDGSLNCPTCGQELPSSEIDKILEKFNVTKSKRLEEISQKADRLKNDIVEITKEKETESEKLEKLNKELQDLDSVDITKESEYKELNYPSKYIELGQLIRDREEELSKMDKVDNSELIARKKELSMALVETNNMLQKQKENEKLQERIKEYEVKEKECATEFEEQQRILYLCDEYTKTYVDLVSSLINDMFTNVKFKLFDTQINGGITETCEPLIDGVPFSDANNASKINAGLDIINTLSRKMDIEMPIFVDNAESVNKLIDVDSQLIRLIVSNDKELNIEF